jgi:hypothetical protein
MEQVFGKSRLGFGRSVFWIRPLEGHPLVKATGVIVQASSIVVQRPGNQPMCPSDLLPFLLGRVNNTLGRRGVMQSGGPSRSFL